MTPFEALYGYKPPMLAVGAYQNLKNAAVGDFLKERAQLEAVIKDNLEKARSRMKWYADKKRTERVFQVGDCETEHPFKQCSIAVRQNLKLASKYYGPYLIIEKVGEVAYRLQLPPRAQTGR